MATLTTRVFNRYTVSLFTLFLIAVGILSMLHAPTDLNWTLDHDGGGMYPASDCGHNFWLMLLPGDKAPCTVRAQKVDDILPEAARRVQEEYGTGPFEEEDFVTMLEDKIVEILDGIAQSFSMH